MPKFDHHFLPLSPPVPREHLTCVRKLAEAGYSTRSGHVLKICLLGRAHTVDVISVSIPESAPQETREKWLREIFEHLLTILRLCYSADVCPIYIRDGWISCMNQTDDDYPQYGAAIDLKVNSDHVVDAPSIMNAFVGTSDQPTAVVLALIAESIVPNIPPHYQVLSAIRALEFLFPVGTERAAWLDRYQEDFVATGASPRQFRNALPELRTRCAHGLSRGGALPLTGLGFGDQTLRSVLQLLRRVAADAVRTLHGIDVRIGM